jgi:hypothetical protein
MSTQAFSLFLQDLRDGRAHSELSAGLADLLAAVKDTGKGGSLTLQVKVKPATRGKDMDKVVVIDNVKVDLPKPERGEDFFFVTDENELSRKHPRQQSLELREVTLAQPTNLKEAAQ